MVCYNLINNFSITVCGITNPTNISELNISDIIGKTKRIKSETIKIQNSCYTLQIQGLVGHPYDSELKHMVCYNLVNNFSIAVCNITNSTNSSEFNMSDIIDKTKRRKSEPIVFDYIQIPKYIKYVNFNDVLSMDIIFVDGLGLFLLGSRGFCFLN